LDAALLPIVAGLSCLVVVLILVWVMVTYNKLVRQRNQMKASWAQIDVQLKRRHDLIPNLVETVRGYAAHEREALEAVVKARSGAVGAAGAGVADRAEAENLLTQALGRLFALSEAYPDLKANQNFGQLQRELATTEDKIAYARQFYNSAVQTLTNTIQSVPSNLVASMFGFRPPEYFEATGDERGAVQVRF
jgi:LemA protein